MPAKSTRVRIGAEFARHRYTTIQSRGFDIMSLTTDWVSDTVQLGANSPSEQEVSFGEIRPETTPFLIGLLLDSIQRERASMTAFEENMNALRLSLIERKRAIDQQEDMLRDLSRAVMRERDKHR